MSQHDSTSIALTASHAFEGHPITFIEIRGERVYIAREIGRALEYARDGGVLVKNISQRWSKPRTRGGVSIPPAFRMGTIEDVGRQPIDCFLVEGAAFQALKAAIQGDTDLVPPSDQGGTRSVSPLHQAKSLLLLTESGKDKAIARAQTPKARAFENWLVDEVLPSLRRTGQYTAPQLGAAPPPPALPAPDPAPPASQRLLSRREDRLDRAERRREIVLALEQLDALHARGAPGHPTRRDGPPAARGAGRGAA